MVGMMCMCVAGSQKVAGKRAIHLRVPMNEPSNLSKAAN